MRMGLSNLSPEELAAWVSASCAAQGVPVKVSDPTMVRRVGALLGAPDRGEAGSQRSGNRLAPAGASVGPDNVHAGRVHGLGSGCSGSDHDVVDQCGDDRSLTGEVQVRP